MSRTRRLALALLATALLACSGGSATVAPTTQPLPTLTTAAPTPTPTLTPTPTPTPTPSRSPRPSPTLRPVPTPTATHRTTPAPPPATFPAPRPLPPGPNSLFVLGDSVLISAETAVRAALRGWVVTYDAVGSRRLPQGIQELTARRSEIGRVVVIQQGNNYIAAEGSFADQIDQAMRVLRGTSRVVWLTVAEKWPSRVQINNAIRAAAARWPTIVVGDWARLVAAHPEYAGDMLHLSPEGRLAMARLIAQCVGPAP